MELYTCRACENHGDPTRFTKSHYEVIECTIAGKYIIDPKDYWAIEQCDKWEYYD